MQLYSISGLLVQVDVYWQLYVAVVERVVPKWCSMRPVLHCRWALEIDEGLKGITSMCLCCSSWEFWIMLGFVVVVVVFHCFLLLLLLIFLLLFIIIIILSMVSKILELQDSGDKGIQYLFISLFFISSYLLSLLCSPMETEICANRMRHALSF